jgi:mono/diheme cytochrome c family protein
MTTITRSMAATLAAGVVLAIGVVAPAAEETKSEDSEKITYMEHVRPILRQSCFTCHNQNTARSGLSLDNYESLMEGGASGTVIEVGDAENSWLYLLVTHEEEPAMPPGQPKLADEKLAVIEKWILGGALKDAGSKVQKKKKPAIDLSVSGGSAKPEGPVAMPEGLSRQPVVHTDRAAAATAIDCSPWAPLAAVGGQRQVALYHTDSGKLLGVLPFEAGIPYVLKFSRSGALLLAGGGQGASLGTVFVYDVKTGQRVFQIGDELDAVLGADINNTHTRVALGGPQQIVRVFSTADGTLLGEIDKHTDWIYAVEFSPDGVLLATADRSGGLHVWEAETLRLYMTLNGHEGPVTDVSWRADSNLLASAGEDGTVRLWEMHAGKQIKSIKAHNDGVMALDVTHDGRIVSAGRDRIVKVWDATGEEQAAFEAMPDVALEVAFTHDGGRAVAGDFSGDHRLVESADGKVVGKLPPNPPTLQMRLETAKTEEAKKAIQAELRAVEQPQAKQ